MDESRLDILFEKSLNFMIEKKQTREQGLGEYHRQNRPSSFGYKVHVPYIFSSYLNRVIRSYLEKKFDTTTYFYSTYFFVPFSLLSSRIHFQFIFALRWMFIRKMMTFYYLIQRVGRSNLVFADKNPRFQQEHLSTELISKVNQSSTFFA